MITKVLVVEDEAITALDLKYSLEELGYEVIDTVDTGQDAIEVAKEKLPDVVLMDIKLKGNMEGDEAAAVISEFGIAVIYLTANTDIDTFEKTNANGTYGFVAKPYDINKLDETLKATIEKAKSK